MGHNPKNCTHPPGHALVCGGPQVAPFDVFPMVKNHIYTKTLRNQEITYDPLPQLPISKKTTFEAFPVPCRRVKSSPLAIFIIAKKSMTSREQFTSGLRVFTCSYVFDISLSLVFLRWHDLDVSRYLLIQLDHMVFFTSYLVVMNLIFPVEISLFWIEYAGFGNT